MPLRLLAQKEAGPRLSAGENTRRDEHRHIMRNGQNKRMRGRNNHRKSHNPMVRVFESNGPDVKTRGNRSHTAEKYIQLARDAQASGDHIAAENYYQHAEHYYRVIAAAQEQYRQNNPYSRSEEGEFSGPRDEPFEEGDDSGQPSMDAFGAPRSATREPPPYIPRDVQPYQQAQPPQHQPFRPSQEDTEAQGEPGSGGGGMDDSSRQDD